MTLKNYKLLFIINAIPVREHLKRTVFKSEEIFHVSNTQYSQYSVLINHCTLLWPRRTTNFFIINATPIRQHFKRTVFKKTFKFEEIFHLSSKLWL